MEKIIIDAEKGVLGRISSYVSKQALLGKEVAVLNSEKVLISGRKEKAIEELKERRDLNSMNPEKGPYFSKDTEKILKRAIRGMLPDYRRGRGKEAWRRIKCYNGLPEEFKKEKIIKMERKLSSKFITLGELKARA